MLEHFPALIHGNPKSVLIIGFGAGVTAGSFVVHPSVERIVIVEIEPEVPAASGVYFKDENYDVLNDPRVELILDDARHYITTTKDKFDVITTDPIHPWVKGAAALYSKEFYELAKARLTPGGLFTQWVPLYDTNEAAVKSEIATFFTVFPNGTVWNSDIEGGSYDTIIIGGVDRFKLRMNAIQAQLDQQPRLSQSLQDIEIHSAKDILVTFIGQKSDMDDWLANAELNLDRNLRLEYLAGEALDMNMRDQIFAKMVANRSYPFNLIDLSTEFENQY